MRAARIAVVSIIVLATATAAPAQKIYLAMKPSSDAPGMILRADLDGAALETILELEPYAHPVAVAVDPDGGWVYWTEELPYRLRRATLQGHNFSDLRLSALGHYSNMRSVALDTGGGKVYWTEDGLRWADLDGSNMEVLWPGWGDIVLDVVDGHAYWGAGLQLTRLDLDGSNPSVMWKGEVNHLDLDRQAGKVYWSGSVGIRRANLDGSNVEIVIPGVAAGDVAVDGAGGHVYWVPAASAVLMRADLDGSNVQTVLEGLPAEVAGIFLDLEECSGHGNAAKGPCACDAGWSGVNCDCSEARCPEDCTGNGECICGICVCDEGWRGDDCACSTACPGDCSGHGGCACGVCECEAGWTGEDCSCSTAACANDCSGNGTCICGACVCEDGWDGVDCACEAQPCPNDCSGRGVCGCGLCTCELGWQGPDCSQQTAFPVRVFLAPDGLQHITATSEHSTYFMPAGASVRMMAWLVDAREYGAGGPLNAYQLMWPMSATPVKGASGLVNYIDNAPGQPGGDSVFVDTDRSDWLFTDTIPLPLNYHEDMGERFGLFYATLDGTGIVPAERAQLHYLAEFDLETTADASGLFEMAFRSETPGSYLFNPNGANWPVDWFQPLTLVIGQTQPLASLPPHGSIDPRQPSDLAGQPLSWPLQLTFNGESHNVAMQDFEVSSTAGLTPAIGDVVVDGATVTLTVDGALPPGACTTFRHLSSGWYTTLRALPGDVNGDGTASALDVLSLIDHLNGGLEPALAGWQCDVNRSGACEPQDILRLVDLLNGAVAYEAWNGLQAPECP